MQINLQFSEREYLRGGASEIVQIEQKNKFPLRFLFPPSLHSTPRPQKFPSPLGEGLGVRPGQGEGLYFRLSQYVKDRLFNFSRRLFVMEGPAAVLAPVELALLIDGLAAEGFLLFGVQI